MSDVLCIIPARANSTGIPRKNFQPLAGMTPLERAVSCAFTVTDRVVVTSDEPGLGWSWCDVTTIQRAPELATDTAAMIDVLQDVLARVPGPPEQICVLLQPTQPLRTPAHIQAAVAMFDRLCIYVGTVVSVVATESPDKLFRRSADIGDTFLLKPWESHLVERRQDARPAFRRDGTVYAWRRSVTFMEGPFWPLIINPSDTCALDTPDEWAEAERRLRARG